MGFLDSAGLAHFTAWVKERLAGKLDRTGGVLGEQEEFSLSSFPIPYPDAPDDPEGPKDEYRFYLNSGTAAIEHSTPEISAAIELTDASVRLYGYSDVPIGSELVVDNLEIYAKTTGESGEVMEMHLTPQDLTISATGEGGTPMLTFDSADGLKVTKCAEPVEDSMPATKGYVDSAISAALPAGVITMWSGAVNAIPSGWALCNGENGTPDLRDRFVVGAGSTYAVGATGGEAAHTLTTSEMPSHSHRTPIISRMNAQAFGASNYAGQAIGGTTSYIQADSNSTGGGEAHNNLPPYYALCYIMKL